MPRTWRSMPSSTSGGRITVARPSWGRSRNSSTPAAGPLMSAPNEITWPRYTLCVVARARMWSRIFPAAAWSAAVTCRLTVWRGSSPAGPRSSTAERWPPCSTRYRPQVTHARVVPPGPAGRATVVTLPVPGTPAGERGRSSAVRSARSRWPWRTPVRPSSSCRTPGSPSHASRAACTFTWSNAAHDAVTTGHRAASGPRWMARARWAGASWPRAAATATLSSRPASRGTSASSGRGPRIAVGQGRITRSPLGIPGIPTGAA